MTGTRDPQQDGSIQAMLRDSGLEASTELRSSLAELRSLVPGRAPAPRADLAALLAAGSAAATGAGAPTTAVLPAAPVTTAETSAGEPLPAGVTNLAERRGRKRRLAIVGGAVVGAMALGAGAVAASSEDFRHNVGQTLGVLVQPAGHAPAHVQPSPADIPADPAAPTTAAPTTAAPATAAPDTAAPAGASTAPASPAAGATGSPAASPHPTPPAVGRDGELPTPGQGPETPRLPAAPGLPDGAYGGDGEDLRSVPGPITPTVPGQP